jgi:hypothetical protein
VIKMDGFFDPDDESISEEDTAKVLRVTPGTLATWRALGKGPKYRKPSDKTVEYTPRFIKEYLAERTQTPTSAKVRAEARRAARALLETA